MGKDRGDSEVLPIPAPVRELFEEGLEKIGSSLKAPSGKGGDWTASLYPPQKKALSSGIFSGKNLLLCTGTGSGKTLVAELASLNTALSGKKVVYITPLRALSQEKHSEFKAKYGSKLKISLSIGGLDSEDGWLSGADIIFLTTEKLDALMRHRVDWLGEIGLVVADEIHEIGSSGRGPTLEMVLVKLRKVAPGVQILALSATVGNAKELSDWLDARLVESDFRPVPLKEGTISGKTIEFLPDKGNPGKREERKAPFSGTEGAVLDTVESGSQAIVFNSTRKSAQKTAEELSEIILERGVELDKRALLALSKSVLGCLPVPTEQCILLSECVKGGAAFHHAGLVHEQKALIEEAFRKGTLRALSATVTLVAGMNLPARRVVLKSMVTWGGDGPRSWPVSLYKQACGRAGRPGLDTCGESLAVAKDERAREEIVEKYILGETEEVSSLLGSPPVLRKEVLGAIASGFGEDWESLLSFFDETFYSKRNGGVGRIEGTILLVLEELVSWGFAEYSGKPKKNSARSSGFLELGNLVSPKKREKNGDEGKISLTPIGKRVAELYLDPLSAREIIEGISGGKGVSGAFPLLVLLASTTELMPGPSVRIAEEEGIWDRIAREKEGLAKEPPEPWEAEAETFVKSVKLALALEAWINEVPDREIMDKWGIAPGDLRGKLVNSDWVCYSASELSKMSGKKEETKELLRLQARLEHGVKEELLDLIRLKGIGRVRARKLHSEGLKTASAVLNTKREKLADLLGDKVAEALLSRNS